MRTRSVTFPIIAAAAAALTACGGQGPVSEDANSGSLPAPATSDVSDPSGAPPQPNAVNPPQRSPASASATEAAATMPAELRGRWGMTPEDCTSTRGDAKGLLVIGARGMRFYESRAVPTGNVQSSADSFSADFAFTGEGMSWTRFQTLQLQDGKLVRTESTPMASYTYARCD